MTLTWVPNALTVARCGLAIVVAWLILVQPAGSFVPAVAFVFVAITDFVDGWAARRLNAVSAFGTFLDPVADKLLVGASLLALALLNDWAWSLLVPTLAIVIRDVVATGLRLIPSIEMPVSRLAKWKTALEMIGILGLLLAAPLSIGAIWTMGLIIVWLAAALSVYTLGLYCGALIADSKRPHS
ncbi:MAG: CDP-alcohol phosphatidyltransferase family protein [Henriciella sp.]|nr:CDP-alcohol phosphatidyltransferase family protein [Henriciella sp.]